MKPLDQIRDELAKDECSNDYAVNESAWERDRRYFGKGFDAAIKTIEGAAGEFERKCFLSPNEAASQMDYEIAWAHEHGRQEQFEQDRARIGLAEMYRAHITLERDGLRKLNQQLEARLAESERRVNNNAQTAMCFVDDTKALKAKLAQAEISIASLDKHRRELDQTRQRLNAELAAAEAQIAEMNQKCISLSLHESRMAAAEALVIEKHDQTLRFIAELEKANQRIKELEQRLKPEPYVHTKDWPT